LIFCISQKASHLRSGGKYNDGCTYFKFIANSNSEIFFKNRSTFAKIMPQTRVAVFLPHSVQQEVKVI